MLSVFEIFDLCCQPKVAYSCRTCGGSDVSATKRQQNSSGYLTNPVGISEEELSQYLLHTRMGPEDAGTVYYDALESISVSSCS